MKTKSNEKLFLNGVWTPIATIQCPKCHYNTLSGEKAYAPKPLESTNYITTCDKCNEEIQIQYNIAHENNFCKRLKEHNINAYMAQTGGMNSAVEVSTKDDGYILIVYDITGDKDWLLDFYDKDGAYLNKTYTAPSEDEMLEYVLNLDCLI